jgi:ABC-type multidrug transport system fused ATPase/permease subunit
MSQFSDDEVLGKAYDSKLMKRLLAYIKPYRKYVVFAIILNILVSALGPLRAYLTKIAVDDYIFKAGYSGLLFISLLMFASLIVDPVIQ